MSERPTPEQIIEDFIASEVGFHSAGMAGQAEELTQAIREHGHVIVHRDDLKASVCECLIAINADVDPVNRAKWGPIIPPTAIDWIGNKLVNTIFGGSHE